MDTLTFKLIATRLLIFQSLLLSSCFDIFGMNSMDVETQSVFAFNAFDLINGTLLTSYWVDINDFKLTQKKFDSYSNKPRLIAKTLNGNVLYTYFNPQTHRYVAYLQSQSGQSAIIKNEADAELIYGQLCRKKREHEEDESEIDSSRAKRARK